MSKLRSTLDIVLERTKDLTLTEEQKAELRCEEWTQKSRGLLQRYRDGFLSTDDFRKELDRGRQECPELERIVKQEFVIELDPDGDYQVIVQGLKDVLGIDPAPYIVRLKGFAATLAEQEQGQCERKLADLSRRGISGSAVVPNLEGDTLWQALKTELRAELNHELLAL
jgi:hypothetical protein